MAETNVHGAETKPTLRETWEKARHALGRLSCGHDLVCSDEACRTAGHEHEDYGEDGWGCGEECPCVPACAGHEPDLCDRAAGAHDAVAAVDELVFAAPAAERDRCDNAAAEAAAELRRARTKHAPMRGPHEGYAVLLEEVDELWDEVKRRTPDHAAMRKEAIQIAAMALAFAVEVCAAEAPGKGCPVPNCHAGMLRDHNGRDAVSCPVCDGALTAADYQRIAPRAEDAPRG